MSTMDYDKVSEILLTICLGGMALYYGYRQISKNSNDSTTTTSNTASKTNHDATKASNITVSDLLVYPVKSCAEVRLASAQATAMGFAYDRIWQVTETTENKDHCACTARNPKYAKLFTIQPTIHTLESKDGSTNHDGDDMNEPLTKLVLTAPNTKTSLEIPLINVSKTSHNNSNSASNNHQMTTTETKCTLFTGTRINLQDYGKEEASKWFEAVLQVPPDTLRFQGMGQNYTRQVEVNPDQDEPLPRLGSNNNDNSDGDDLFPVSLADEAPYLLTSTSSLTDLNRRLEARGKAPVDMRRFRPNIVVHHAVPWQEDTWKRIRIGRQAEFYVWQRCGRCAMTTIDRDSLLRGPEPLATLSTFRERAKGQRNFGMHLIPVPGTVPVTLTVGDTIEVLEYDTERQAEFNNRQLK